MDEVVNLLEGTTVVGSATLTGLPTDRYPTDLKWLRPVLQTEDGRVWLFKSNFAYGDQPTATYVLASIASVVLTPVAAVKAA
jgi:hypothetical protein